MFQRIKNKILDDILDAFLSIPEASGKWYFSTESDSWRDEKRFAYRTSTKELRDITRRKDQLKMQSETFGAPFFEFYLHPNYDIFEDFVTNFGSWEDPDEDKYPERFLGVGYVELFKEYQEEFEESLEQSLDVALKEVWEEYELNERTQASFDIIRPYAHRKILLDYKKEA
jgi:hypothetical protein